MAFAMRLGPDVYRNAGGAALLAVADDLADLRAPRLLQQVDNGMLLNGAVLVADLFNVLPDNTPAGEWLDGARDAAVAFLVRDGITTPRLNGLLGGTPAAPVATPAAPAAPSGAAGASSTQVAVSGAAASDSSQAAY